MKSPDRLLIRLANDIQDQLTALSQSQSVRWAESLRYPIEHLQRLSRIHHKLGLCQVRHYHAAARQLRTQLGRQLPDLICEIEGLQQLDKRRPVVVPSLRDLVDEIHQIQEEFDTYDYSRKSKTLSITTDPIELEGIELGRFRIDLRLDLLALLGNRDIYSIEALEPNSAATDSGVTHPHVSHGRLCEGDASAPIRAALQEGRICDFFLLVRSVLQTYNAHSPYVSLKNWESQPCHNCGYSISDDNRYCCESCDHEVCDECSGYCRWCDRSICQGCLIACPHCQEPYCERCLDACSECRQPSCPACSEDNVCPTCKEKQKEDESHEQEEQPITDGGSASGA